MLLPGLDVANSLAGVRNEGTAIEPQSSPAARGLAPPDRIGTGGGRQNRLLEEVGHWDAVAFDGVIRIGSATIR